MVSVSDLDCSEVELLDEFSCIHVHITDVNDQSPRFMKKHFMIGDFLFHIYDLSKIEFKNL